MTDLIAGQIEAMVPMLLAAQDAATAAAAEVDRIKSDMATIIGQPGTVRTVWGSVTLNNGRRTVKVTNKALEAQIKFLKETGISEGKCVESIGGCFITVRRTDR